MTYSLSNLAGVQKIEHRVGGSPGHKEDAIDDHREQAECPMAARAVRPDPLDRHFNREHDGDNSQQTEIHFELPHRKIGGGDARQKQQQDDRRECTKDHPDLLPRREQ